MKVSILKGLCILAVCMLYSVWADDGSDYEADAVAATGTDEDETVAAAISESSDSATNCTATDTATASDDGTEGVIVTITVTSCNESAIAVPSDSDTIAAASGEVSSDEDAVLESLATSFNGDNDIIEITFAVPSTDDANTDDVTTITSDAEATATAATSDTETLADDLSPADHIVCICKLDYEPVCGSNGVTYTNECMLRCASSEQLLKSCSPVSKVHDGECGSLTCKCPQVDQPVCGTNNQTYTNECYRVCENTRRAQLKLPLVGFAYKGICRQDTCMCPDSIVPVCGTDNKTYRNLCILQYHSRRNIAQGLPAIYVKNNGPCKNETCVCPLKKKPLCASDDNTYHNQCALDCQNRKRSQLGLELLKVLHPGECEKCVCPSNFNPVCASDGNTYLNYCILMCKNKKRRCAGLPELTVQWHGLCNCGCSREWKPVCANDRKTWPNPCLLNCENKKRFQYGLPPLIVLYKGECKECNCCHCSNACSPVCGSDRQTYWNTCFLSCHSNCRVASGLPPIWKIADKECKS